MRGSSSAPGESRRTACATRITRERAMPIKLVPLFTVHISILQSQCKWIPEGEPGKVEINSMLAAIGPVLSSSYPNRRSRFRYYQDMLNRTRAPLAIPLILAAAIALPARSQQISFEVASVKPQPWTGQGSVGIAVKGNTLYGEHVALTDLVQFAYNLRGRADFRWALLGKPGEF